MGVLPVNMPQWGGSLLRFVMMSSQIPTLARGGGGSGFQLISALDGLSVSKFISRENVDGFLTKFPHERDWFLCFGIYV